MKKGMKMKKFILIFLTGIAALIAGCAKDTLPVPTEPLETVTPRPTFSHTITRTATESSNSPTATLTATPEQTATFTQTATATATVTPLQPAVTAVIPCGKDTMIISAAPYTNYGSFGSLNVGAFDTNHRRRSLFYFDLSGLPTGAVIEEVRFRFYVETLNPQSGGSLDISAYKLTAGWDESTATWDNTSGGSYTANLGSVNILSEGSLWVMFLNIATVQQWFTMPADNHGFILISTRESTATAEDVVIIRSKEETVEANKPALLIKYRLP